MRAMILAAGLGTRLRPLSALRAKPALPVRGIPVIAHLLQLLSHHGVTEIIVNLHHLADGLEAVLERYRPSGMGIELSREEEPLGTGGGIRRAAAFLSQSDPSLVLAGDMILDVDLRGLAKRHRSRRDLATLLLLRDGRQAQFGTIGVDGEGAVRRIGNSFDQGGETEAAVFSGVRLFSPGVFDAWPEADAFEDLRDWLVPRIQDGMAVRGEIVAPEDFVWRPVGTPHEYLAVNFEPPSLSFWDADAVATSEGTQLTPDCIVGADSHVEAGAQLRRCVVWDGEHVPGQMTAENGVFAGGRFHACGATDQPRGVKGTSS